MVAVSLVIVTILFYLIVFILYTVYGYVVVFRIRARLPWRHVF